MKKHYRYCYPCNTWHLKEYLSVVHGGTALCICNTCKKGLYGCCFRSFQYSILLYWDKQGINE